MLSSMIALLRNENYRLESESFKSLDKARSGKQRS